MYRNNFIFTFSDFNNIPEVGIYKKKKSRELIPCEEINIAHPKSKVIIRDFLNWLNKHNIADIYNFDNNSGYLHNISVRNNNKNEFMLEIYLHHNEFVSEYVDKIKNFNFKSYNIISVYCQIFDKHHDFRGSFFKIYGCDYLNYYFNNAVISILPGTFFQTNNTVLFSMYQNIADLLNKDSNIFLDLYCGVGVMSILANSYYDKCYGIEINRNSIEIAKFNCRSNCINNIDYICSPVENIIYELLSKISDKVTIFINPPRSGLKKEVIIELNKVKNYVNQIIYLSCSEKTLERDLQLLNYNYEKINEFDMFNGTFHKEHLCILN